MRKMKMMSLVLALFLGLGSVCLAEEAPAAKKFGGNVGDFMKPVELKTLEGGKTFKTDALPKKTIFLIVSSVCTACRAELTDMEANLKEFDGKADIYTVIIDMDPASALERIKKLAPSIPLVGDADYAIGSQINLISAPASVILDKDGKILFKKSGYVGGQWKEYAKLVQK